jgi:hypothetical protein
LLGRFLHITRLLLFFGALPALAAFVCAGGRKPKLIEFNKIWDSAPHNAFTDLTHLNGVWYCTFREGTTHQVPDGRIRVISSADGKQWQTALLVIDSSLDLRDPKLCITPDKRLMLHYAGVYYQGGRQIFINRAHFSADGINWTEPKAITADSLFAWRVSWHEKSAYTLGWKREKGIYFCKSDDGLSFSIVKKLDLPGTPNEGTLAFDRKGEVTALIRKEDQPAGLYIARSKPPYTEWHYSEVPSFAGGPNLTYGPDSSLIAGFRTFGDGSFSTVLRCVNGNKTEELITLPSSGDNGYPGLCLEGNTLWVSYYSSHEGKASIYLAKIAFPMKE